MHHPSTIHTPLIRHKSENLNRSSKEAFISGDYENYYSISPGSVSILDDIMDKTRDGTPKKLIRSKSVDHLRVKSKDESIKFVEKIDTCLKLIGHYIANFETESSPKNDRRILTVILAVNESIKIHTEKVTRNQLLVYRSFISKIASLNVSSANDRLIGTDSVRKLSMTAQKIFLEGM